MNKAYKFRIYPDERQRDLFSRTFGCARLVYNKMLEDKIAYYNDTGKTLHNTPAQYKVKYPFLAEVDSLALANAQVHLQTAYANFFRNPNVGFPKFKSKHTSRKTYTTNCVNNNIALANGFLKLPKAGLVKIKQHRPIPDNYVLKSVTVSQSPDGKYYAGILFEYDNQVQEKLPTNAIGLDYSMHGLYRDSEGNEPDYPRYYRQAQEKLTREQRKLSKMQKGSHNRDKQRIKVARLHAKVSNQRKDFLHKLSHDIAERYDCVCVEDLDMKAMSQCLNFGKSVMDNAFGCFLRMLEYKLADRGSRLVKVGRFFASSQTCSVCGYKYIGTKDLSVREWDCPNCGAHHDRDINAAINIRNEGLRIAFA